MRKTLAILSNKVYLVRHGQSIWNHDSKFTGWTDIPLTEKGEQEARETGRNPAFCELPEQAADG